QPWSAAGAENPIVTVSPGSSLLLPAAAALSPLSPPPSSCVSGVLDVQDAINAAEASTAKGAITRRRNVVDAVMSIFSLVGGWLPSSRWRGGSSGFGTQFEPRSEGRQ